MRDYMDIQQEILSLTARLSSDTSDIGDWKIAKYQEYVLSGQETPYSIIELHDKRQVVRDRINELKQMLENASVEQEEN